jgi:ribosome recycling factor
MAAYDKTDLERRMAGAVEALKSDLAGLRTGRASTALLDPVMVTVYGSSMPLNQVATVSAPEPRMLSVQVWDKSNVGPTDKAIRSAGLGLNPIVDGQTLRLHGGMLRSGGRIVQQIAATAAKRPVGGLSTQIHGRCADLCGVVGDVVGELMACQLQRPRLGE